MSNRESASFGALLLHFRTAAGITQEQLAAWANVSPDTIAALEHGRRRSPRGTTVSLLVRALRLHGDARAQFVAAARSIGGSTGAADMRDMGGVGAPADSSAALGPERGDENAIASAHDLGRRARWSVAEPIPLVDRVHDLDTILRALTVDGTRLLTLVGPAGVGKTRLALAAVAELAARSPIHFPDGVVWVDLAPVRDSQDVLRTIGRACGFKDMGYPPLDERLVAYLAKRTVMLVLDNFEQVLSAAPALATLLGACPRLAILVTSRVPLRLRWEQTLRVAPLPVPDLSAGLPSPDALVAVPSVALFVSRARARRADFTLTSASAPLVAQLVVQLDGLPLALELAAARLDILSLPMLVRRLSDRLHLLASEAADLPERQRSLEAAVGWSYDLLSEPERRLFRCLGVFVGRVALDAITAVASEVCVVGASVGDEEASQVRHTLERLVSLAEKSLVLPLQSTEPGGQPAPPWQVGGLEEPEDDPEPAFSMLETVRGFAQEQLATEGELETARRAQANYFLALAERADLLLRGPDQRVWFLRLEHEQDNLRAALRWLLDQDGPNGAAERELGLRLAGALGYFWWLRGYHVEGRRWLEEALDRAPQWERAKDDRGTSTAVRTRALLAAGALVAQQGDYERSRVELEEALALAQRRQDSADIAKAMTYLGACAVFDEDYAESVRVLREALTRWRMLGDVAYTGVTLYYLSAAVFGQGNLAEGIALAAEAFEQAEVAGNLRSVGAIRYDLAVIARLRGDLAAAMEHVRAGLQASVVLQDRWLLSIGIHTALAVLGEHADPSWRAQLLGAEGALTQATGATSARAPFWAAFRASLATLPERLRQEDWDAAYRQGQTLHFGEVAALALSVLEEVAQTLASPESDWTSQTAREALGRLAQRPGQGSLTVRAGGVAADGGGSL